MTPEYYVAMADSPDGLKKAVEGWMTLGFVCQGGVTVSPLGGRVFYYQALIREVPKHLRPVPTT